MRAPRQKVLAIATIGGWLGAGLGCVDDHPIVTGNRPATSGTVTSLPTSVTDPPRPDRPDCAHCSAVILDSVDDRGVPLCVTNNEGGKKTSAELLAVLFDCACTQKCVSECSDNACVSVTTKAECVACASDETKCKTEFDACLADVP